MQLMVLLLGILCMLYISLRLHTKNCSVYILKLNLLQLNVEFYESLSDCRPSAKTLLQLDFFTEDTGLSVEVANREDGETPPNIVALRLRVVDPKKRRDKHKENEAIQFEFDLDNDQAEDVALEMVHMHWLVLFCLSFLKGEWNVRFE